VEEELLRHAFYHAATGADRGAVNDARCPILAPLLHARLGFSPGIRFHRWPRQSQVLLNEAGADVDVELY
jgi:hypothetical protein